MKQKIFFALWILFCISLTACGTMENSTSRFSNANNDNLSNNDGLQRNSTSMLDTSHFIGKEIQEQDDSLAVDDTTSGDYEQYAEQISTLLEHARTHYIAALEAQSSDDSTTSAEEFEASIQALNELSTIPIIDSNQDFNDLSHAVIEDYEKYIAKIDSLGPKTSIFALREKLNQFLSQGTPNDTIAKRVIKGTIPLVVNGYVEKNIYYLQKKAPHHFKYWMENSGKYLPIIEPILKEVGVPDELKYLAMIESGMNPRARSWARAVGLWQFVKGTGKLYGLKSNYWYDERCDVVKATYAAARLLKDLHEMYNDWYLALAAYNSGAGRVNRAIRKSGTKNFWHMWNYLPRETRNYVPEYIATVLMARAPKEYGFTGLEILKPIPFDTIKVKESVDLSVLSRCANTTIDTIQELNPVLLRMFTPSASFTLNIPKGRKADFADNFAKVPASEKREWLTHTIKKGETLKKIAGHYGISAGDLADANQLNIKSKLRPGKDLIIPISRRQNEPTFSQKYLDKTEKKTATVATKEGMKKVTHRIQHGETLNQIAAKYDVRISDIRNWNNLPYGKKIRSGKKLTLYVEKEQADETNTTQETQTSTTNKKTTKPERKTTESERGDWISYEVKEGDALVNIAKQFNVEVEDIKQWNGLRSSRIILGTKLDLLVEGGKQKKTAELALANNLNKNVPATGKKVDAKKIITHRVKRGDNLYVIAKKYGVSLASLKEWNNLPNSKLKVGMELKVYL